MKRGRSNGTECSCEGWQLPTTAHTKCRHDEQTCLAVYGKNPRSCSWEHCTYQIHYWGDIWHDETQYWPHLKQQECRFPLELWQWRKLATLHSGDVRDCLQQGSNRCRNWLRHEAYSDHHLSHRMPALDGEELKRIRFKKVPVTVSWTAALVKWITMPSPAYIPRVSSAFSQEIKWKTKNKKIMLLAHNWNREPSTTCGVKIRPHTIFVMIKSHNIGKYTKRLPVKDKMHLKARATRPCFCTLYLKQRKY